MSTPTRQTRPGRPRTPRLPCQCGCAWETHHQHRALRPCRTCRCPAYTQPPPPLPTPPALRAACTCVPQPPRRHVDCPACAAWLKNQVLLTTGGQVGKAVWVAAHEVHQRPTKEETR